MPDNPEFSIPLTFTADGVLEIEQGSDNEIQQQVFVVLSYFIGDFTPDPLFGVADQVFRKGGIDIDQIKEAVTIYAPDAEELFARDPGWLSTAIEHVLIQKGSNA